MANLAEETTIQVVRFETYPGENPVGYAVGFNVTVNRNGRSFYRDTVVPFVDAEGRDDKGVVAIAFDAIREGVEASVNEMLNQNPIQGMLFVP